MNSLNQLSNLSILTVYTKLGNPYAYYLKQYPLTCTKFILPLSPEIVLVLDRTNIRR